MKLSTNLFDYNLPDELIAQFPAAARDASRMMVMDRNTGECTIQSFSNLPEYLQPGDAVIFNDTRVMSARMYGIKNGLPGAAKFEILLVSTLDQDKIKWNVLLKPGKRAVPGTRIKLLDKKGLLNDREDWITVLERCEDGSFVIKFNSADNDRIQQAYGHIPLPPYIRRGDETEDSERYQTVFARDPGAVAAPTAGLHFTPEIMEKLRRKGVKLAAVTLHVGPGTFKPVSVDDPAQHKMHEENFTLPPETAELINSVRTTGGRVLAIGTTTVRVLESCVKEGKVYARKDSTDIFLYPPYRPQAVDMLLTNFHLPKSTLLMLVSTFTSRENVLAAYALAIKEKMRFYSYGDCMLLK